MITQNEVMPTTDVFKSRPDVVSVQQGTDNFSQRPNYTIPFIDFRVLYEKLQPSITAAIERVVQRQWFILGPELQQFEEEFRDNMQSRYCVGVGSGFDALKLSLMALQLDQEDEVILPANTFVATFLSVVAAGARPVLCDVEYETQNMSVETISKVVTARTRAIIPVHLFGSPCPMDDIVTFAKERNIHIVEDTAQAHGASLHGKKVGTFGSFGAFSVYPGKNLGAYGDGGVILCQRKTHYDHLLKLRNYGFEIKNYCLTYGENSRLDEIQSAILSAKLAFLDSWNEIRNENAKLYKKFLSHEVQHQEIIPGGRSCYHAFVITVDKRDALFDALREQGVEVMIHYPWPIHKQPVYKKIMGSNDSYPAAEKLSKRILTLPVDVHLDAERIETVAYMVNRFLGG